jgi:hypothetical protein
MGSRRSAVVIAQVLGACSPTTMCRLVLIARAIANDTTWMWCSLRWKRSSSGRMTPATAGSVTAPSPSDASVTPSWHADR